LKVKEYTCIVCPQSCRINLTINDDGTYETEGNVCKRGRAYVINEYTNPQRMLTTTVKIEDGIYSNLPVVSEKEIVKDKYFDCLKYLYSIKVKAPVKEGDIIVKNIMDTGVNILAARDMIKK